jgi:hypothetical protein
MHVVLCNPGAAGDLVASLIDDQDYYFPPESNGHIHTKHLSLRGDFRGLNANLLKLNQLLPQVEKTYKVVTSHWFETFLSRNYPTIVIDDSDDPWYKITSARFNKIVSTSKYDPIDDTFVLQRRTTLLNFIKHRPNEMVIKFQDIVEGRLVEILQSEFEIKNPEIYQSWLQVNTPKYFTI